MAALVGITRGPRNNPYSACGAPVRERASCRAPDNIERDSLMRVAAVAANLKLGEASIKGVGNRR
jgi:hypothetical protein